ncbi:MAG: translocation and assembly module TamA [Marivirga sp.]|jgi:hypothetical protein
MKITVITSLFAKWDVYVYTAHSRPNLRHKLWGMAVICLLITFHKQCFAQETFSVSINKQEQSSYKPELVLDSLNKLGYLLATYGLTESDTTEHYKFSLNNRYSWNAVFVEGNRIDRFEEYLKALQGRPANQFTLTEYLEREINQEYHNRGYPFAKATLSISSIKPYTVEAVVYITVGPYITFDSLVFDAEILRIRYLEKFLMLSPGSPWSTASFAQIEDKINVFDFVRLKDSPELAFAQGKAKIELSLEKTVNDQIDAIIGLIPSESGTMITGQADIRLSNLLRSALSLDINWRKFDRSSQSLLVGMQQYRSFGTPLGLQLKLSVLKQDSSFVNVDFDVATNYILKPNLIIDMGYRHNSGNAQIVTLDNQDQSEKPLRSSRISSLVLGFRLNQESRYPQLKKLFYMNGQLSIGQKEILNYDALPSEWRNAPKVSLNSSLSLKIGFQQKLAQRITIEEVVSTNTVFNDALAQNDFLRLGALNNLRGFDQYFFFTSNYQLLNVNARYFLNNKSSFLLIADLAYLNNQVGFAYSSGVGLDLKTKNGWFRLLYALGMQNNESINISAAKVHFGYIALF